MSEASGMERLRRRITIDCLVNEVILNERLVPITIITKS